MAVVAGVESAVQIHINRGDDLNARDDKGQTPLMLSAARNKAAICKLLLAAGADANLLDLSGQSALGLARAAGAREAMSVIEAACVPQTALQNDDDFYEPAHVAPDGHQAQVVSGPPAIHLVDAAQPTEQTTSILDLQTVIVRKIEWTADEDGAGFDSAGWEAEEDQSPPKNDLILAAAAIEVQRAITEHQPVDTSTDWDSFEAFLPDRATPLIRADDAEAREQLRLVLLRAIREGSVPISAVEDLMRDASGVPNDEAVAHLRMVINDLGAETDERFEYSTPGESFEVFVAAETEPGEEDAVSDALAFLDNLAGPRNEPLRIYQREFQREALLTAEAEVALGQAMERGIEKALDALAAWPVGVNTVIEATEKVASGAKPLRWLSYGPPAARQDNDLALSGEPDSESVLLTDSIDIEDDVVTGTHLDLDAGESFSELAEFSASAALFSDVNIAANQDGTEELARRAALAALRLTRSFLLELTDIKLVERSEATLAFAQAMGSYRRARDQMAVANLKLVFSIAKKYLFSGQPLDDLLQEGNIGLIKAVDRYDWRRGFKFSTYASWWIRQQVGRHVADKGKTIRLPVYVYEKTQRIAQCAHAFELRQGHAPTVEEIAALVELPVHKVAALRRMSLEPVSFYELDNLDEVIAADAKDQFASRDPMDIVEDIQSIDAVARLLGTLSLKEENVLRMRFGMGIQDSQTLEEIGAQLELTRERIRQIEAKALKKLKHPARLAGLLRALSDAPPLPRGAHNQASFDANDDLHGDVPTALTTRFEPATQADPRPIGPNGHTSTMLDKLLDQARAADVTVEDYLEGDVRRIWVYITDASNNRARKLVRKLLELGFKFWPGKGYWR